MFLKFQKNMLNSVKKLTDLFSQFPTIGKRTANRFSLYLLHLPNEKVQDLILAIQDLKNKVKLCPQCFNPYETNDSLCSVCQDPSRNGRLLCVIEKETDMDSIESTGKYRGLYFILGQTIPSFKANITSLSRLPAFKERIQKSSFSEIIIATNPTPDGKATSALIERALRELANFSLLKITHLARGLPSGGELEYADQETLESAFEGRK